MSTKLWQRIASANSARLNCIKTGNKEWESRHEQTVDDMVRHCLPRGSGFDMGTRFDFEKSTASVLVFHTAFHHMDDNGYYDGWTEHTIRVRPAFDGVTITISGPNRREIKDYMADVFYSLRTQEELAQDRDEWERVSREQAAALAQS